MSQAAQAERRQPGQPPTVTVEHVVGALDRYRRKHGFAPRSLQELADDLGCSYQQVYRRINQAEEAGLVTHTPGCNDWRKA